MAIQKRVYFTTIFQIWYLNLYKLKYAYSVEEETESLKYVTCKAKKCYKMNQKNK